MFCILFAPQDLRKKTLHGGGKQGSCNTSKRGCNSCLMVSICFNMIIWFNMVQNLGDFLSYQTGLSAFDVNSCLHIVTSLQLWCLFLSRAESHLTDDLFMTSFTACCKWSLWMFKVFDRVTKKRQSPDLLLKHKNAHPISWTSKKATSLWHLSLVESFLPPEMACETVKLSTLWGFFWALDLLENVCLGGCAFNWARPLSLHQLPTQNWTILKSACRTLHSPSRCISSRSEQKKKRGHETAQPTARCRNEPTGPWAIQTTCFGWCLKIREHLQEFPHTNDYTFGMKQIISKMIFCRLSKFETYGQFYQRLLNHHKTQLVSDLKAAGSAGSWELVGRPSSVGSREKRDVKSKLTWSIPIEAGGLKMGILKFQGCNNSSCMVKGSKCQDDPRCKRYQKMFEYLT